MNELLPGAFGIPEQFPQQGSCQEKISEESNNSKGNAYKISQGLQQK
jgi:hypothetical protein